MHAPLLHYAAARTAHAEQADLTTHLRAVRNASAGKAPVAVSEQSMRQPAPSSTALATSVISARVGRGLLFMLSSSCLEMMTGLPAG